MVPVAVNTPDASLAWSVLPGTGTVPSGAAVTLNVFDPVSKRTGGAGVVFGSLKKNAPSKSPQLSLTKSTLVTFATAPLSCPIIFAPFVM